MSRAPAEISMYDVIASVAGTLIINRCTVEGYMCENPALSEERDCNIRSVFCQMCNDAKKWLSAINFQALTDGTAEY